MCRADPTCGDPYIRDGQIQTLNEGQEDFECRFQIVRMIEKLNDFFLGSFKISPVPHFHKIIKRTFNLSKQAQNVVSNQFKLFKQLQSGI